MTLHFRRPASSRCRGQALAEFALVLPLLLLLMVGILDFGRAVYASHTIGNAAREAARLAIVDQNPDKVRAHGADHAVGLSTTVTATYWNPVPNADPAQNGSCSPVVRECIVVLTVVTDYVPATPIIGGLIGPIRLTATTEMPVERAFSS